MPTKHLILFLTILLVACTPTAPTPSNHPDLLPYHTATVPAAQPTATQGLTPTAPPLPTATPFVYTVVEGDTLIGIAAAYGLTLPELLAANPGLDPQFLSIGANLTIPSGQQTVTDPGIPTPTPAAALSAQPYCYPTAIGGLTCFWLITNPHDHPLENLTGRVLLLDNQGASVAELNALTPLNLIPPTATLPLVAEFLPPVPAWETVQAQLLTALQLAPDDARYLPVTLQNTETAIQPTGASALVTGQVRLPDTLPDGHITLWVVAVAYDETGAPVGLRRWETAGPGQPNLAVPFSLTVYSLASPIATVDIFLEARPAN